MAQTKHTSRGYEVADIITTAKTSFKNICKGSLYQFDQAGNQLPLCQPTDDDDEADDNDDDNDNDVKVWTYFFFIISNQTYPA